ncbi:type VI secretion system contractile sheath protein TssC [Chryseolinea sp. T2]|uniref:type VI secretion system contractile sheath protein TssC n=1 Tax=Chryseolinea sp. T2 TaxID=3129255 RepID=UPI0030779987
MAQENETLHSAEKEASILSGATLSWNELTERLADYGGFEVIEGAIESAKVMNPESKGARKNIFLGDPNKAKERQQLKSQLKMWVELLSGSSSASEIALNAQERARTAEGVLKTNLKIANDEAKALELAYRTVAMFYKNAETEKIKNLTIFNVNPERVKDLDNTVVIDKIAEELKARHDRLDLRENYSMLVLPGYLGSNKVLEKWAKIAYENKVMLITDFLNLDTPDAVMEDFDSANLTGGDIYRSNVLMTCNWLVGRAKRENLDEEGAMMLPPSTALAGRIYNTLIAQPTAGKTFGGLSEVDGVSFPLKKGEISELEKRGLIPMVKEWEKVMAFSAKTLYTGNDIGLQTYSVVRVFDYIGKVIIDFLNRQAFINWTPKVEKDLKREISRYLESIKGSDKIIQDFNLLRLEQDEQTKRIYIDLHITPFFPAKNFMLKLGGTKGDTAEAWASEYAEQ